jgi:uncharacterized LabA/DUF88 family protein
VGKNVAVFVDVANIFYAAKAAGVDIDYVTLLKASTAGRDLVRAYAYTGLDPDNENQRNFHEFLRRSNYKVVSKDIRKYGDGKVKANLDIELVVDMMKTARNLDIAIVVSGDGDFAPAIRAVQEQGVRVEVISFRGNTSSDLIDVADQFTDIVQLARVEKGTRSGRRVADDEADLSMTEVPDKQTEGTGAGRGRGRRGRGRTEDAVAATTTGGRTRGRGRGASSDAVAASATEEQAGLVALPGERLSRAVGSLTDEDLAKAEVFTFEDAGSDLEDGTEAGDVDRDESAEGQRRRRRRGGRGRGRGRGRTEEAAATSTNGSGRSGPQRSRDEDLDIPPRAPRPTPFGSVWDSQLGTPPPARATSPAPIDEDEDFDEPEIPEYLIAEQRRSGRGQGGRGARGGRSAYQSAMDRERYGRGGGGGINRYPDVSGRNRQAPPREERSRSRAPERAPAQAGRTSDEPWSDVPPELEAMLRAQVSQRPASDTRPVVSDDALAAEGAEPAVESATTAGAATPAKATRTRTTRKSTTTTAKAPARTRTTRKAATAAGGATADAAAAGVAEGSAADAAAPAKATRTRTTRKSTTKASATADATAGDDSANPTGAAPKRRSTRKAATAAPAEAAESSETA